MDDSADPPGRQGRPEGSTEKAGKRKRGTFSETAEQFIRSIMKGKCKASAGFNKPWNVVGQTGLANNTLTKSVKAKTLKRAAMKGERAGNFRVA